MPRSSQPSQKYLALQERYPEFLNALENLGQTLKQQGPIEQKQAHLIQLAAAAATDSEGAVHSHTKRALGAGASAEEIRHAILLLTSTIGFPKVMAALTWADDILEQGAD